MIINIALGDAYGAPFEFADNEYIEQYNDGIQLHSRLSSHGSWMGYGRYTDDTQMSMAIAEYVLSNRSSEFTPQGFANWFFKVYNREKVKRNGYSSRIKHALDIASSGAEFSSNIKNLYSSSNGSVMRTIPLGMLSDPQTIISAAIAHSVVTHCHKNAIDSTILISLLAHSIIYNSNRIKTIDGHIKWSIATADLDDRKFLYRRFNEPTIPCDAIITTRAVLHLLSKYQNQSDKEVLKAAIFMTGDVDSVAALVMGLRSLNVHGFYSQNPLRFKLEREETHSEFGLEYLSYLDNLIWGYVERQKLNNNE